jgi:hypothetical protein
MAQEVGTAAAVNQNSTGTPPGHGLRVLALGARVVHNERIRTDSRGSVQLLFNDRTAMSIGPNSEVTIDEYVYDPRSNTGKLAVRIGKGVMRFVGGQVSHTGEATVTTPSASIGIRGGTGIIAVSNGRTRTINLFGRQTVHPAGESGGSAWEGGPAALYRPGYMLDVSRGGTSSAAPVTSNTLASYNTAFEAKRGQHGGRHGRVTAAMVAALADRHNVTGTIDTASYPVQGRSTYSRAGCAEASSPNCFETSTAWRTTSLAAQQGQQSAAAFATAAGLRFSAPVAPPMPPRIPRTPLK